MSAKGITTSKILEVSEKLFVEQGYSNTSLRNITAKASVNLAAVNYHFGDKKTLVRAILDRYLTKLMPEVNSELIKLNQSTTYTLEEVFYAIRRPLINLNQVTPNGMNRFLLLIANGYMDIQGHLRWFIVNQYGDTLDLFINSVRKSCPEISDQDLFWKLHFSLGAFIFATISSEALSELASSSFENDAKLIHIIDQAINYITAGIEKPNKTT
ncbi:TetR/AcrR family transcriptional regulator [Vibrio hangzhouensis]|uniref:TetR/AcrR family transcriptional regulator n=1 Tax=Vibrio hangzhouensis TaxID=462991 RepID=UPI001C940DCD|nr:TetR/AcrR family transcriptional regulator [Vibrio hangzhouensis]MBY6197338.1 TetR family transcriptional regulator [Vibrio hangzhouensis]